MRKGQHHSEESRKKISESHKGEKHPLFGKPLSDETKKKISDAQRGKKSFLYGKHPSEETREKMSESHRGIIKNEEWRRKLSESCKKSPEFQQHLKNIRGRRPTKPQLKLFEVIKSRYPNEEVMMEFFVKTPTAYFFIDVAIPKLLLGFEYDEPCWHKDKEKDMNRHHLIEAEGWKLVHFSEETEFCQIKGGS